jgi:MFS family permease
VLRSLAVVSTPPAPAAPAGRGFVHDLRVVLRSADYRKLLATRLSSQLGDGALLVTAGSYVLFDPNRAATAAGYALTFTVLYLPYSIIGPFAGIVLDRWQRRQVLLVASAVRAVLALVLALLLTNGVSDPVFVVLVLTIVGLNRFFLAGQGASIPRVVRVDELVMANAVTPTLGTILFSAGGVLAVMVSQLAGGADGDGNTAVASMAALFFLATALLMTRLDRQRLGPDGSDDLPQVTSAIATIALGLVGAVRHLVERYPAGMALLVMAAHRFAFGFVVATTVVLFRNFFYDPDDVDAALGAIAVAGGGVAVGAGLAVVLTPIAVRRMRKERWIVAMLLAGGPVLVLPALVLEPWAIVATSVGMGLSTQSVKICVDSLVQEWTADDVRGRAFSLYDMLFQMALVTSAVAAALVLPADGASPGVFVGVAVLVVATALVYRAATGGGAYRGLRLPVSPAAPTT